MYAVVNFLISLNPRVI